MVATACRGNGRFRIGTRSCGLGFPSLCSPPWTPSPPSNPEETAEFIDGVAERRRVNPAAKTIVIRDVPVAIAHDRTVYEAQKIEPSDPLALRDLLRLLVTTHADAIFSTDAERAALLAKGVPGAVKLLTLDSFRHFDLDDCDKPSETEALRMLAEVVVTGDVSRYAPQAKPNTHWRVITRKDRA